jgi:NOL1/NOP2/fmu family ribosome biogenesis protein
MQELKILNSKEKKEIFKKIKEQWGAEFKEDYDFLLTEQEKIYIVNKEIARIDFSKIKINSIGMYFGKIFKEEIRLSVEGAQMIGKKAKKNIIELNDSEARSYMKGNDIDKKCDCSGFVLLKNNKDFIGTAKYKDGKIMNYMPKERRIKASD